MADSAPSVRSYLVVYVLLLALVALTTSLAFTNLGPWGAGVALLIAASKAVLVILYFMHVRTASKLIRAFVVVGFYWLALLVGGTFGDLLTRPWLSPFVGGAP
jgi:cytochrome c oxidase subunit 4